MLLVERHWWDTWGREGLSGDALGCLRRITFKGSSPLKARESKLSGHLAERGLGGEQLPAEEQPCPTLQSPAVEHHWQNHRKCLRENPNHPLLRGPLGRWRMNPHIRLCFLPFLPFCRLSLKCPKLQSGIEEREKGGKGGGIWLLVPAAGPQHQVCGWRGRGRLIPV